MDVKTGKYLVDLKDRIEKHFDQSNWEELGLLTGQSDLFDDDARLYRSLSFGDNDYPACVMRALNRVMERDPAAFTMIEAYLDKKWPEESYNVSSQPGERRITFTPNVFQIPEGYVERDLVSVMMPFGKEFDAVYDTIKKACVTAKLRVKRADDIWNHQTFIQDIFELIFTSFIVVVDFTGRNSNVMYETGIAHTLGKHVVPLTQSKEHIPSDMLQNRALIYLANKEGLETMEAGLVKRLRTLSTG